MEFVTKPINPSKKMQELVCEANRLALDYIEQQARKILRDHPNLTEFVMAMGSCTFTIKDGDRTDYLGLEDRAYFKPLLKFIEDWNEMFGLTGTPMRFTADGPIVRDW